MPTEHEYKYVIALDLVAHHGPDRLAILCDELIHVQQGYLAFSKGMTTRVRMARTGEIPRWFLTFKQKVGDRVIEIEKKLDERDGMDLWHVCVGKLKKDRYVFSEGGMKWELDLFYKGDKLYFILLEVELPEGADRPKSVPDFLKEHVLYKVPLTDDRFSNKRLGDVDYATKVYESLRAARKQGG